MITTQTLPIPRLTSHAPVEPGVSLAVWLRRVFRLIRLVAVLVHSAVEITCTLPFVRSSRKTTARAQWLQRTCRRVLRCLNVHATFTGEAPRNGLLVCNHLSYLDILVLGANQPMAFVSKAEVRNWPLIGWLTQCAGTVFIDREQRSDVARANALLTGKMSEDSVVCLFPEGTSSDGADVLPFRPSLLQPAVSRGWAIAPAHLRYELADGSVEDEVCYWRDMSFGPHLLNLLGKQEIRAQVRYGKSSIPGADRKQLAVLLREQVRMLAVHTSSKAGRFEV